MEASVYAALLMVSWVLVQSEPSCDQAQFLHPNGTCVDCPVCGPGEQLTEDCGYGDGGEGLCVACADGEFSAEAGQAPCWQCTRCSLLNRQQRAACSPTSNARCGDCLRGYYELRSRSGEIELPCMPCYSATGRVQKECLSSQPTHTSTAGKGERAPVSTALVGSATAFSSFLLLLLLWAFLLIFERLKQMPDHRPKPEGLLSEADTASPQHSLLSNTTETAERPRESPLQRPAAADDPHRCPGYEGEAHPTSIVINVTTNIKPTPQNRGGDSPCEGRGNSCPAPEEMEQKLLEICKVAQGQSLELLDYDTVQDLSLLLGPGGSGSRVERLGRSLGVPPEVLTNLHGFQDLFQYLRTSTYTLLPQLAQATALLPRPDVIARIHRTLVTK